MHYSKKASYFTHIFALGNSISLIGASQKITMKSPFDVYMHSFRDSGMDVSVKRQTKNGQVQDAQAAELETLGTKAKIASTAQILSKLSPDEKLEWALEMKRQGNALFARGKFTEANGEYIEALTATDLSESSGNIDTLVIPVLCNMAACCIELKEYGKVVQFCQQAIDLRPKCSKAHLRKGIGFLRLQEYELAVASISEADKLAIICMGNEGKDSKQQVAGDFKSSSIVDNLSQLSVTDQARIPVLLDEARRGLQKDKQAELRQRKALSKAFKGGSSTSTALDAKNKELVMPEPTVTVMHLDTGIEQLEKIRASNNNGDSRHSVAAKKEPSKLAVMLSSATESRKPADDSKKGSETESTSGRIFIALLFGWVICILCWQVIDWNSFALHSS